MRGETNVVRGPAPERARKRAKMNDTSARGLAKQIHMHSKRPRVASKVASRTVQECDLPYFLLESATAENDLPPIPRMKRKGVEGSEISKSSALEPSVASSLKTKVIESSVLSVVSQGILKSSTQAQPHLSDMPSVQPRIEEGHVSISRQVAGRLGRSKAAKRWADDETWTPPKATLPRVSDRPTRIKRCASEALHSACNQKCHSRTEREPKLPTRVQPKRGRGLPLCPHRVVKVYARLLARAGPDLKRSARIVAVEKRLHKGDVPSLTNSFIPKRPNRLEPFTAMARSTLNIRRLRQCWLVPSKRNSVTSSMPPQTFTLPRLK